MYWGNPDASVSFFEDKYNVLPYVAEYYNTMSAISYLIVGLILRNFTKLKKISNIFRGRNNVITWNIEKIWSMGG